MIGRMGRIQTVAINRLGTVRRIVGDVGYKFTAGSKKVGSMKIWQAPCNSPHG